MYSTTYESPVGTLHLAASETHLLGLWLEGQKYFGGTVPVDLVRKENLPLFALTAEWLDLYFKGQPPPISELPLKPNGSNFRARVWEILCEIPFGETTTYGAIAKQLAASSGLASMSSQAVGSAVGRNPVSIIIPCHRVVGSDGSLTGYAGGLARKMQLLTHEGAQMSLFYTPTKGTAL